VRHNPCAVRFGTYRRGRRSVRGKTPGGCWKRGAVTIAWSDCSSQNSRVMGIFWGASQTVGNLCRTRLLFDWTAYGGRDFPGPVELRTDGVEPIFAGDEESILRS
jgi:hypothetical protein